MKPEPAASGTPREELVLESPIRTVPMLAAGATNWTQYGASDEESATAALVPDIVAELTN